MYTLVLHIHKYTRSLSFVPLKSHVAHSFKMCFKWNETHSRHAQQMTICLWDVLCYYHHHTAAFCLLFILHSSSGFRSDSFASLFVFFSSFHCHTNICRFIHLFDIYFMLVICLRHDTFKLLFIWLFGWFSLNFFARSFQSRSPAERNRETYRNWERVSQFSIHFAFA